jgi:hypothetical protein
MFLKELKINSTEQTKRVEYSFEPLGDLLTLMLGVTFLARDAITSNKT